MTDFEALEPAIDPNNKISFLLDWELTMKCNLDCDYCLTGLHGGHDNSTKHPPTEQCLRAIEFMYAYADLYMATKPKGIRYVFLNVYGGESLHHPDIIKILEQAREYYKKYQDKWKLSITTTTNAIVTSKKLEKIIPLVDEFTVSYHTTSTAKQKQQFKDNLLQIAKAGRRQKCVVMMHPNPDLFADAQDMLKWLENNNIKYMPKAVDHLKVQTQFNYNSAQVHWFDNLYQQRSYKSTSMNIKGIPVTDKLDLADTGRACCGGRQLCKDTNHRSREYFVAHKFPDWYCSVNHFFLFVKQLNGEIYVNKDCKMNFDGTVGPIGNLSDTGSLLAKMQTQLSTKTLPVIQCKKYKCYCGLCAPKAKNFETYNKIMEKFYQ